MSTLTEFHLFQALPRELRLQIWGIALSIPRNVNIACDTRNFHPGLQSNTFQGQPPSPSLKSFTSSDRPPALLHVCRESRLEALRIYKPFFQIESSPKYIYVAFSQDTIKTSDFFLRFLRGVELQGIQKMAINVNDPISFGHGDIQILKEMQPNLTELELLVEPWGHIWEHIYGRHHGEIYLQQIKIVPAFIRAAMVRDPGWRVPDMKIVDRKTGKLVERILGGAAIPIEGAGSRS